MNINATILVQAFNFFIVYWMLRSLLFKPVITIIEHEAAEKNAMMSIIDQQQKSLIIQEKERQRHWYLCQEYFASHKPDHCPPVFLATSTISIHTVPVETLSTKDIAHEVFNVHKALEEKIKHVH